MRRTGVTIWRMECAGCHRFMMPVKTFSWGWFLLGGGLPYLLYFVGKSARECPVCELDVYMGKTSDTESSRITPMSKYIAGLMIIVNVVPLVAILIVGLLVAFL